MEGILKYLVNVLKVIGVFFCLYCFICSLDILSTSFKLLAGEETGNLSKAARGRPEGPTERSVFKFFFVMLAVLWLTFWRGKGNENVTWQVEISFSQSRWLSSIWGANQVGSSRVQHLQTRRGSGGTGQVADCKVQTLRGSGLFVLQEEEGGFWAMKQAKKRAKLVFEPRLWMKKDEGRKWENYRESSKARFEAHYFPAKIHFLCVIVWGVCWCVCMGAWVGV